MSRYIFFPLGFLLILLANVNAQDLQQQFSQLERVITENQEKSDRYC